jgi:hypothetical protein
MIENLKQLIPPEGPIFDNENPWLWGS